MKTREVQCPSCKEKMQAPVDRERILCMFCGTPVILGGAEKGMLSREQISAQIAQLFDEHRIYLSQFQSENYESVFGKFVEHFQELLDQIGMGINRTETDFIIEEFIRQANRQLEECPRKNEKEQLQFAFNSYMAVYVFPAILHNSGENAAGFCESLRAAWSKSFKNSQVKVSSYEVIQGGFKKKLCYITTAVCEALHKGTDCEEVTALKEFRDNYLASQEQGEALIQEYYNIAPTIVKRIEKSSDREEKYLFIWNTFLKPCLDMIKQGQEEQCQLRYQEMVEALRKEYMEEWHE